MSEMINGLELNKVEMVGLKEIVWNSEVHL